MREDGDGRTLYRPGYSNHEVRQSLNGHCWQQIDLSGFVAQGLSGFSGPMVGPVELVDERRESVDKAVGNAPARISHERVPSGPVIGYNSVS